MESHKFRLVYDGLGASQHKMPTALEKQITTGAQEFLAAHAYFYTEGKIPTNVGDHSRYFNINDVRLQDGSLEAIFDVDIMGLFREYMGELTKNIAF